jgi:Flp pilus assembly pilin Flp
MDKLMNFLKDEEGATAVEYALMVALIAVVIILAVTFLGGISREHICDVGSAFWILSLFNFFNEVGVNLKVMASRPFHNIFSKEIR